jgi:hypothetical protein
VCSVTRGLMIRASRRWSRDRPARSPWPDTVSATAAASSPVGVEVVALLVAAATGSIVTYLAVGDHRAASTSATSQTATIVRGADIAVQRG